ncbi:competence protein ComK [Siminovitchia fortis]|uniref:Competence transcription factor n=1 Tax=Siminovitchia fortis TaxID=254758 RepID=A0A443IVX5_9BACI|nr:competence protein ComK [Siminovitchia fortis]RWR12184.1 hypothetical protein D4N35_007385 [Siminovitchia fortis]WHY80979.1 competence protein ComK [Siminovitchia fortis]
MELREFYIIKRYTYALIPMLVENGYIFTKVIEGRSVFLVKLRPLQIIRDSMQYYGHDWEGAKKAAKSVLGSIHMPPVKISGSLGIYWFPSKSPYAHDCVWFALDHIQDRLAVAPKETKVFFPSGHHVTVPISLKQFNSRKHWALELKTTFEKRTIKESFQWPYIYQGNLPILNDPTTLYQFIDTSKEYNIDDTH